jgi:hypothetical protein
VLSSMVSSADMGSSASCFCNCAMLSMVDNQCRSNLAVIFTKP